MSSIIIGILEPLQSYNFPTQTRRSRHPSEAEQNPRMDNAGPNSDSLLLTIPFEIRQRILELLLPYTSIDASYGPVWHEGCTTVLDTCHQLRKESASMIYSSNTFVFKISLQERPRFLMRSTTSCRAARTALDRVKSLVANPEPEIHLICNLHLEIMESDSCVWTGDHWTKMLWFPGTGAGTCPLNLQRRVRSLMALIPQWWGGGTKTAKIVWLVREKVVGWKVVGWKERKTILQPLYDAGVQVQEQIMREVDRRTED
ncbi:MAG: hypothetical protein OHK93_008423 [Ramalina farinacea]|uniref:F-box domain-containing protein n=1 Tax=Ramalina farinacea TaxID=258253 RepID=A0AA43QME5_9LECA|nr:hypothetical protein [Ramalina farinacea]